MMFRFANGRGFILACAMLVLFASSMAGAEDSRPEIGEELKIMSRVLEASLDSSGIENWHARSIGYSAFDSKIRHEYIPTVGAIFTIDVAFPLVKPEEEAAKAPEEAGDPEDLWERMSKQSTYDRKMENQTELIGIGVSLSAKDDGSVVIVNTFEESPAVKAGIDKDDVIVEVDGKSVHHMPIREVADLIGGPEGSEVTLKFLDADDSDDNVIEVRVERVKIKLDTPQNYELSSPRSKWVDTIERRFGHNESETLNFSFHGSDQSEKIHLLQNDDFTLQLSGVFFQQTEYDAHKVDNLRNTLIAVVARYGHRMTQVGDSERILLVVNGPGGASRQVKRWSSLEPSLWQSTELSNSERDHILFSFGKEDLGEGVSSGVLGKKVQVVEY